MNAVEVIDRAIELLERDGWAKGTIGPSDSQVSAPRCLRGALFAAAGGTWADALKDAHWLLSRVLNIYARSLASWNDHLDRTYDDVLAALRNARELAAREMPA